MGQPTHHTNLENHLRPMVYRSKLKNTRKSLDDNTKELILDSEITDEHGRGQDTLPDFYKPYFGIPLSTILYTLITARKN